uniref:NUDIX domain-containing protein n=1 Tax=Candidatus Electrothrix sp. TaxID=2170559 RepID=UPI004055A901
MHETQIVPLKRAVSRGVFIQNKKILLCKAINRENFFLIGGGIKKNETPKMAIEREVIEETGKICSVISKIGTFCNGYRNQDGIYYFEKNFLFLIHIINCQINEKHISKEKHIDFFWKNLDEVGKIDLRPNFLHKVIKANRYEAICT